MAKKGKKESTSNSDKNDYNGKFPADGVFELKAFAETIGRCRRRTRDKLREKQIPVFEWDDGRIFISNRRFAEVIYEQSRPLER